MGGSKEARQGLDAEKLLAKYLSNNLEKFGECLSKIGINFSPISVEEKPKGRIKCDIMIKGKDCSSLCISLKTVTDASFHQLDRRWLKEWESILNIPPNISQIFQDAILRVAKNPKSHFILPDQQKIIAEFIRSHLKQILNEIFKGNENDVRVLAIFQRKEGVICLFNMDDVISFFEKQQVSFSNKGIIKIGEFITLQRKGGNSFHIKKEKTDPDHPGNQLQFKFKPLEFSKRMREGLPKSLSSCCLKLS
jgi:hypothetical protein